MAEYGLMLGNIGGNIAAQVHTSLGAAYHKLFQNPLLLGLVIGGAILLGCWAFKAK